MMVENEELVYYDVLYDFASVIVRLNQKACDGESRNSLQKKVKRLCSAFDLLCGVEHGGEESNKEAEGKPASPEAEETAACSGYFLNEKDGWGLCPVCRKKMTRLTSTTKLINLPAYCKSCKCEFVVNWWNTDNKEIEYTRYVQHKRRADGRDILHNGMKGTGIKSFMRTGTSATERVAMNL